MGQLLVPSVVVGLACLGEDHVVCLDDRDQVVVWEHSVVEASAWGLREGEVPSDHQEVLPGVGLACWAVMNASDHRLHVASVIFDCVLT